MCNINYLDYKIYKIVSPSHPDLIYYGGTTVDLDKRWFFHKKARDTSLATLITCYDDAYITLVEPSPCESKQEANNALSFWIQNYTCVNIRIPGNVSRYGKNYKHLWYKCHTLDPNFIKLKNHKNKIYREKVKVKKQESIKVTRLRIYHKILHSSLTQFFKDDNNHNVLSGISDIFYVIDRNRLNDNKFYLNRN